MFPGTPYLTPFLPALASLICLAAGAETQVPTDVVRRRVEGAKASAFFEQWLAA